MQATSLERLYERIEASGNNRSVGGGEAIKVADAQTAILMHELDFAPARTVLDYGCGIGRTMPMLFQKIGNDKLQLDGCDISAAFVGECRALYEQFPFRFFKIFAENPHYSKFDVSQVEEQVPANFYDLAYSFSVFTHLTMDMGKDTLARLKGRLRAGGKYYFTLFRLDDGSIEAMNSGRPLPFAFSRKASESDIEYFANEADPLAFVALQKNALENVIEQSGFAPVRFIAGGWRGIAAPNIHDAYIVELK